MIGVLRNVVTFSGLLHHNWGEFSIFDCGSPKIEGDHENDVVMFERLNRSPLGLYFVRRLGLTHGAVSCKPVFKTTKFSLILGPSASNSVYLAPTRTIGSVQDQWRNFRLWAPRENFHWAPFTWLQFKILRRKIIVNSYQCNYSCASSWQNHVMPFVLTISIIFQSMVTWVVF
jgi:hypothetical protein